VVQIRQRRQLFCGRQTSLPNGRTLQDLDVEVVRRCQIVLKPDFRLREITPWPTQLWLLVHGTLLCALLVTQQADRCKDGACSTLVQQLCGWIESFLSLVSHPELDAVLEIPLRQSTYTTESVVRSSRISNR